MKSRDKKRVGLTLPYDICVEGEYLKTRSHTTETEYRQESTRSYTLWRSIQGRIKEDSAYGDVENKFASYQAFAKWCNSQEAYKRADKDGEQWHLDKDILFPSCRTYSEETCCFAPRSLNAFFKRGLGFHLHSQTGKYEARVNYKGVTFQLGLFTTQEEAKLAYLTKRVEVLQNIYNEAEFEEKILSGIARHIEKNCEAIQQIKMAGKVMTFS